VISRKSYMTGKAVGKRVESTSKYSNYVVRCIVYSLRNCRGERCMYSVCFPL